VLQDGGGAGQLAEAASWYRRAAEQDHVEAQTRLATLYRDGQGVAHDDAEAVRWLRRAAYHGYAPAVHMLAALTARGRGTARDDADAVHLYEYAAGLGDLVAAAEVAWFYIDGRGVERDEDQAAAFIAIVVEGEDADAFNALAWNAAVRGRDLERALAWATRAAALAPDNYAILDTLAYTQFRNGQLDPALATEGRAIAAYPDCGPCLGRYGDLLEAAGRTAEARERWEQAVALLATQDEEPEFPRARWVEKLAATAPAASAPAEPPTPATAR
jgi:tetratricopeptide (TPR) repeat protein